MEVFILIDKVNFVFSDDITAVNKEQYNEHLKLYEGYVTKINEIDQLLKNDSKRQDANATYSHYRALKRGETFAMDGIILHELYFENMGGNSNGLDFMNAQCFKESFPSMEEWKEDFIATAKASRGWAILAFDQRSKMFRNCSLDAHDVGNITLSYPIIVLDVYEHAYFYQYGTDKVKYINNFMNNINSDIVNQRIKRL